MEELKTIEQYASLVSDARKKGGKFTNNSFFPDDIQRYIGLKRIRHIKLDFGLIFVIDEGRYYRLLLHIDANKPWDLPELDKPSLIFTWYTKDKKKPALLKVEEQIQKKGFTLENTQVKVMKNITGMQGIYKEKYLRSKKILDNLNARIIIADYSYYGQIQELLKNQDMIKYFQFPYQTEGEIKSDFENGMYTAVVNDDNKVLAYTSEHRVGDKSYADAMVIKEEYKLYGLAPLLSYYGSSKPNSAAIRQTNVALNNYESIKFHKKLGWKFTNKYMENWLLD